VLLLLDGLGICASTGSACTTRIARSVRTCSTAMGLPPMRAAGSRSASASASTTPRKKWTTSSSTCPASSSSLRDISPLNPEHPDNDAYDIEAAREKHETDLAEAKKEEETVSGVRCTRIGIRPAASYAMGVRYSVQLIRR
jgi:hypothetical protein